MMQCGGMNLANRLDSLATKALDTILSLQMYWWIFGPLNDGSLHPRTLERSPRGSLWTDTTVMTHSLVENGLSVIWVNTSSWLRQVWRIVLVTDCTRMCWDVTDHVIYLSRSVYNLTHLTFSGFLLIQEIPEKVSLSHLSFLLSF